ncbi:MAG: hypothetical protein O2807_06770, partial [bacterium]|nr:hypothetical protein [bacterium]
MAKPPVIIPGAPPAGKTWYTEFHTPQTGFTIQVRRTYFEEQSPFQHVRIIGTEHFGRMLILDGAVQTTERDEFIYHEMLVHPALFIHRRPRR